MHIAVWALLFLFVCGDVVTVLAGRGSQYEKTCLRVQERRGSRHKEFTPSTSSQYRPASPLVV